MAALSNHMIKTLLGEKGYEDLMISIDKACFQLRERMKKYAVSVAIRDEKVNENMGDTEPTQDSKDLTMTKLTSGLATKKSHSIMERAQKWIDMTRGNSNAPLTAPDDWDGLPWRG